MTAQLQDMKEALGTSTKPDTTHVRYALEVAIARACEYGSDKYQRSNYRRPVQTFGGAFERYRSYLRAAKDHISKTLDKMELHQATDPDLCDTEGMKDAAYAPDLDAGANFPASRLPHVYHGSASLNMAITQAVDAGLLPLDAGTPWCKPSVDEIKPHLKEYAAKFGGGQWFISEPLIPVSESPDDSEAADAYMAMNESNKYPRVDLEFGDIGTVETDPCVCVHTDATFILNPHCPRYSAETNTHL